MNLIVVRLGLAAAVLTTCLLQACVVYPKVLPPRQDACQVASREVDLAVYAPRLGCNGLDACATLLLMQVAVGTATLLVSGSVALIGNTLHWTEVSARCPEKANPVPALP